MDDEKKVFYLLLHIGDTLVAHPRLLCRGIISKPRYWKRQQKAALNAAHEVGIKISIIPISPSRKEKRSSQALRYFFRFPRYKCDDSRAQKFAESFMLAIELLKGPSVSYYESQMVFRVPADVVRNKKVLFFDDLRKHEYSGLLSVAGAKFFLPDLIELAWKITPVIFYEDNIHRALLYLRTSHHHFFSAPPSKRYHYDPDLLPEPGIEQTNWENSLFHSYKAVEAIIGDLPKDDTKLKDRLESIGLDPAEEVGFVVKRHLIDELKNMNKARDKKGGHGSTPKTQIKLWEMQNYQECARYVIQSAIETKSGTPTLFE